VALHFKDFDIAAVQPRIAALSKLVAKRDEAQHPRFLEIRDVVMVSKFITPKACVLSQKRDSGTG
tara:strand:+ start:28728 stop:28922 length:195 start_codon:yes stop_codon:yes gene_type:complete